MKRSPLGWGIRWWHAATVILVLTGCGSGQTNPGADAPPKPIRDGGPALAATRLPDLQGRIHPLSEYEGKAGLLLMFVDTQCPACTFALDDLPQISKIMASHGVPTAIVAIDSSKNDLDKFFAPRRLNVPIVYDVTEQAKKDWQISLVPTVVLLNSAHQIVFDDLAQWKKLADAAEPSLKLRKGTLAFNAIGPGFG